MSDPIAAPELSPIARAEIRANRRFQNYRGTWAWLIQRVSAIGLFLLIPIKIYTGWASRGKVPELPGSIEERIGDARHIHLSATIDILLLFFFLIHAFYGLRVILMDFGVIRENSFFWRALALAVGIFAFLVWYVYIHGY
jgi:succinate dehydrogenase hydrophobic anchor subunit